MQTDAVNIFWFRRDLRLEDNAGLYHALRAGLPVLPLFIFDTNILNELPDKSDPRVTFIYKALEKMQTGLKAFGSSLKVVAGTPEEIFRGIFGEYHVTAVFTNNDYEAYALKRDAAITALARQQGIAFHTFKDQVIREGPEVLTGEGKYYSIFTPYYRKWQAGLDAFQLKPYPVSLYAANFLKWESGLPALSVIGFTATKISLPPFLIPADTIKHYDQTRDFPYLDNGTSRLGIHLRFGTISIRQLVAYAARSNETYLKELVWREFYQMVLQCFPQIRENRAFKAAYDLIPWRNAEADFEHWKAGTTGIPIVDAGMRELSATGYMHNRVRMIVASFLTKTLLIDWRWGEAWFAEKLLDYDFASNNGGWQWAAGSGCDAAPYFRIFNPYSQAEKFDPQGIYIKKWVPELGTRNYPEAMVDLKMARDRCLKVYKSVLSDK